MNSDFSVAVHALVFLAHKAEITSSDELAENICTNAARVRKVMSRMKRAGLAESIEGVEGGYRLGHPAAKIALADIARALDTRFVATTWHSGDVNKECLVSSGMGGIMDDLYDRMDGLCLQYLEGTTVRDIEDSIFKRTKGNSHAR